MCVCVCIRGLRSSLLLDYPQLCDMSSLCARIISPFSLPLCFSFSLLSKVFTYFICLRASEPVLICHSLPVCSHLPRAESFRGQKLNPDLPWTSETQLPNPQLLFQETRLGSRAPIWTQALQYEMQASQCRVLTLCQAPTSCFLTKLVSPPLFRSENTEVSNQEFWFLYTKPAYFIFEGWSHQGLFL